MQKNRFFLAPLWGFLLFAGGHLAMSEPLQAELRSTQADQTALAITIFNDNLALVKDRRRIALPKGVVDLAFRDVSARIQAETAIFRALSEQSPVRVLEQNFDFDLLTPENLLKKYVGRKVQVIQTHPTTGEETVRDAQVLAATQGVVLRLEDHIETGVPGRIVFPDVPPNLRDRPTLVMQLESGQEATQEFELAYLTGGLSWKADYVGELSQNEDFLDLAGWVTLNNTSGTSYPQARLQLIAGDVNRVMPAELPMMEMRKARRPMLAAAPEPVSEEALFEYHLYSLPRPTTIADNQTKQVALLQAQSIPVHKELLFDGSAYYYRRKYGEIGTKLKAAVFLEFENREAANLGLPLPKGIVRIYKNDSAGNAQFIGEDQIDHTPKNEKVRLKLGEAFDVTADRVQTDFRKLSGMGPWQYQFESAYRITVKNGKPESVTVKVREPIPGDWKMLQTSHPYEKESSDRVSWMLRVPPEGKTVLTYRVRVRF